VQAAGYTAGSWQPPGVVSLSSLDEGTAHYARFVGVRRADRGVMDAVDADDYGVVERFFGTLKYEHLCRATVGDGNALAVEHCD
jgi:hypothetical protein